MRQRWRWDEITLVVLSVVFLAAYAWPVVDQDISDAARRACAVAVATVWVAFIVDYLIRLARAEDRRRWFFANLFDLAVLVIPVLRPLRLVALIRVLNRTTAAHFRGRVGAYLAGGSTLLAFVAAIAVLDAEQRDPSANITSFGDALWWACATMTTVGYGDHYPVTGGGRAVGVGLMIAGIALLGAVTATLASWFISSVAEEAADAAADAVEAANDEDEDEVLAELAALQRQVGELSRRLAGG